MAESKRMKRIKSLGKIGRTQHTGLFQKSLSVGTVKAAMPFLLPSSE